MRIEGQRAHVRELDERIDAYGDIHHALFYYGKNDERTRGETDAVDKLIIGTRERRAELYVRINALQAWLDEMKEESQ